MRKKDIDQFLPHDLAQAQLVGRVWQRGRVPGPSVVAVRGGAVYDITARVPTMVALLEYDDPLSILESLDGVPYLGRLDAIMANSIAESPDPELPHLLAPCDLQAIKAAGVTFASSLMERVIEERCRGDLTKAATVRHELEEKLGNSLKDVTPGSALAEKARELLQAQGLWSQYLEVGIGPMAEIFTKSQPMSAVGTGAKIGLHPDSVWNNPEPEVVLVVGPDGRIKGCTLGNDVNLRDFEGRSALLLGQAKDNNASCAIGPFIRLIDGNFTLDRIRNLVVTLKVCGPDGFKMKGQSSLNQISRPLESLAAQLMGRHHQYPDGVMLFTGTMFSPTDDRDQKDRGFTHKLGDEVWISSPDLGCLYNPVTTSDLAPRWTFGTMALMRNLAARGFVKNSIERSCE